MFINTRIKFRIDIPTHEKQHSEGSFAGTKLCNMAGNFTVEMILGFTSVIKSSPSKL